jgi:hypothetical protein
VKSALCLALGLGFGFVHIASTLHLALFAGLTVKVSGTPSAAPGYPERANNFSDLMIVLLRAGQAKRSDKKDRTVARV